MRQPVVLFPLDHSSSWRRAKLGRTRAKEVCCILSSQEKNEISVLEKKKIVLSVESRGNFKL